jgi:hypothetical protein
MMLKEARFWLPDHGPFYDKLISPSEKRKLPSLNNWDVSLLSFLKYSVEVLHVNSQDSLCTVDLYPRFSRKIQRLIIPSR